MLEQYWLNSFILIVFAVAVVNLVTNTLAQIMIIVFVSVALFYVQGDACSITRAEVRPAVIRNPRQ